MSQRDLDMALAIGHRLAEEAVWHEDRCNWVGAWPEQQPGGAIAITYAALGPDLYSGTSGIALFLAELVTATDANELRPTALGAMRQALRGVGALPANMGASLYAGGLGIALAACIVGRLLDEQDAISAARELAEVEPLESAERDLMSGDAGAILALLALATLLDDREPLHASARAFGASLLETAAHERGTRSWGSPAMPEQPPLTGLSHGASGCALALLELWHATAEEDYLSAARDAFAYERTLFDATAANWPDLRSRPGAADGRHSFATLWCHGAPGVALARLRAVELAADEPALAESRVALDTTRRAVEAELAHGGNFSLCHGLAGNAEVLSHGIGTLGEERAGDGELVRRVADEGVERYGTPGGAWPCGTYEGETPGLFLGLAGIGRFYLRLHDPTLPSLVMPSPGQLAAQLSPSSRGYAAR